MITSFFAPKKRKADPAGETPPTETLFAASDDTTDQATCNKRVKEAHADVQELLKHLHKDESAMAWQSALNKHVQSKRFESLATFVANQRKCATVYPPPNDVFSALNMTPFNGVKLIIVGQDPYHGPGQGHGLCFSVKKGVEPPPSLKNIYKELKNDPKVDFTMPTHGYLERWARQGVLMLNTVLTVRRGEANSHKNKGWEDFTDEILKQLARERKASGKGLVCLLWGKPASKKLETAIGKNSKNIVIIATSHPSPLGATKTNAPFLGSRCFSRANDALQKMGLEPIDWNVDGELGESPC